MIPELWNDAQIVALPNLIKIQLILLLKNACNIFTTMFARSLNEILYQGEHLDQGQFLGS